MISHIDWDSDFFGFKIGSLEIDKLSEELLREWGEIANNQNYKLIYILSNSVLDLQEDSLDNWKVVDVGSKVTLRKPIVCDNKQFEKVQEWTSDFAVEDFLHLAKQAGPFSRFNIDLNFKKGKFEEMYEMWLQKSVHSKGLERTFISTDNQKVIAFLTTKCDVNEAELSLMAVDNNYRKLGIGYSLISKAEEYYAQKGFRVMRVVTQGKNEGALRLYLKNGYKMLDTQHVYHLWNINQSI